MDTAARPAYRIVDATPGSEVEEVDDKEAFTELAVAGHTLHCPSAATGAARATAHGLAHLARSVDSDYTLGSPEQAALVLEAAHDIALSLSFLVQGTRRWVAAAGDRGELDGVDEELFEQLHATSKALEKGPSALGRAADGMRQVVGRGEARDIHDQAQGVAKELTARGADITLEYVQDLEGMLRIWQIQFILPGDARLFEVLLSEHGEEGLPWTMRIPDTHPGAITAWVLSHIDVFVLEDAPQQAVELSEDERVLLGHVHAAGQPVEVASFFEQMNPESGERATQRQLELFALYVDLWKRALIRVVVPANGTNADQMMVTGSGEASLGVMSPR